MILSLFLSFLQDWYDVRNNSFLCNQTKDLISCFGSMGAAESGIISSPVPPAPAAISSKNRRSPQKSQKISKTDESNSKIFDVDSQALLFKFIPVVFQSFHAIFQEFLLDTRLWPDLFPLVKMLRIISSSLNLENFNELYDRYFGNFQEKISIGIEEKEAKNLVFPAFWVSEIFDVFEWTKNLLKKRQVSILNLIFFHSQRLKKIILLYGNFSQLILRPNDVEKFWRKMTVIPGINPFF